MSSISERIDLLIQELGYNKNSFSKAIGLGNNVTIGRIINEKRDPSYEVLKKIIETFGQSINAEWLLTGEGSMRLEVQPQFTGKKFEVSDPKELYTTNDNENIAKCISNLEFLLDALQTELERLKAKI